MTIKLLRDFLRDQFAFTLVYFISHILVSVYCNYFISSNIQLTYLFSIYFYVFILFMCFRFIRYVSVNREIQRLTENIEIEEKGFSCEQQAVITLIHGIHRSYQDQIYEVKSQADNTHKFISQWIHNLKTPLSVIDLILQSYKMNPEGHAPALTHIEEEKNAILSMLNQMLKFFRLEHFTRDYNPERVNLLESLRSLINSKRNQYIYNNVYPMIECADESVLVMTDSKWNTAMLEQIVSNAIKYSDAGEKAKPVHFHIEQCGDQVVLSIRDEGIGIEQADLQRVFQPFFTGKNGRTHHQATGIGLYVCSEIARKLGHRLTISSEVNQGTEVRISYLSKLKDSVT
ncbi:HAMP domain-containing sensor histidine kinase [Paenibacillus sp. S150]|uniref:sensor histidine kinase n=1 Tax=Paenibacillus sp. S150 TaxID=2749826 RepID=UPI001C56FB8C|nr:HAMP domain-containing sensor histidine kinase [Paenibacillus sp. S150]MBW4080576.1 HAMP domain-containing histidine kinase [Paenibacillus sp. S150]